MKDPTASVWFGDGQLLPGVDDVGVLEDVLSTTLVGAAETPGGSHHSEGAIAKLLPILAPIVMGMLGRTQKQQGLDARGLSDYLTGQRQQAQKRAPDAMGVLGNLLDTDKAASDYKLYMR